MGRPTKYGVTLAKVNVRVHPDDLEQVQRMADDSGVALSDMLREVLHEGVTSMTRDFHSYGNRTSDMPSHYDATRGEIYLNYIDRYINPNDMNDVMWGIDQLKQFEPVCYDVRTIEGAKKNYSYLNDMEIMQNALLKLQ